MGRVPGSNYEALTTRIEGCHEGKHGNMFDCEGIADIAARDGQWAVAAKYGKFACAGELSRKERDFSPGTGSVNSCRTLWEAESNTQLNAEEKSVAEQSAAEFLKSAPNANETYNALRVYLHSPNHSQKIVDAVLKDVCEDGHMDMCRLARSAGVQFDSETSQNSLRQNKEEERERSQEENARQLRNTEQDRQSNAAIISGLNQAAAQIGQSIDNNRRMVESANQAVRAAQEDRARQQREANREAAEEKRRQQMASTDQANERNRLRAEKEQADADKLARQIALANQQREAQQAETDRRNREAAAARQAADDARNRQVAQNTNTNSNSNGTGTSSNSGSGYVHAITAPCIDYFSDHSAGGYGWAALRNNCSQALHVTFFLADDANGVGRGVDLAPGAFSNTGEDMSTVAAHGGYHYYVCPAGATPVNSVTRKYIRNGDEYFCKQQ